MNTSAKDKSKKNKPAKGANGSKKNGANPNSRLDDAISRLLSNDSVKDEDASKKKFS